MREWFRISNRTPQRDAVEIFIYDEIGRFGPTDDGVTAANFVSMLAALPPAVKTIRVRVNSPGGDVFEGLTIANALRAQRTEHGRKVDVQVDGLAASAATLITSAGQPVRIAANALMMVHRPHMVTFGDAEAHRESVGALDRVQSAIIDTYRWVSTKSAEQLTAMVDATTWMTAAEAVANGFATEIGEASEVTARFDPRAIKALGAVPLRIAAALTPWIKPTTAEPSAHAASPTEILAACRTARLLDLAEPMIAAHLPMSEVTARIERARSIVALCKTARVPQLADGYIKGAIDLADVRAHLTTITALLDGRVEIDGSLDVSGQARAKAPNVAKIYEQRNAAPAGAAK